MPLPPGLPTLVPILIPLTSLMMISSEHLPRFFRWHESLATFINGELEVESGIPAGSQISYNGGSNRSAIGAYLMSNSSNPDDATSMEQSGNLL